MHQRRRLDVVAGQRLVELILGDIVGRCLAERILAGFAQRLAPHPGCLERALAGAVAEKAVVVLQFDIVAVDVDRRQAFGAVPCDAGGGGRQCVVGHHCAPRQTDRGTTAAGILWFIRGRPRDVARAPCNDSAFRCRRRLTWPGAAAYKSRTGAGISRAVVLRDPGFWHRSKDRRAGDQAAHAEDRNP